MSAFSPESAVRNRDLFAAGGRPRSHSVERIAWIGRSTDRLEATALLKLNLRPSAHTAVAVAVSATELAIGAETVAAVGVGLLVAASSAAKNAAGLVNATVEGEAGHARGRWMTVQSGRGHDRGHGGDEILM